MNIQIFKEDIFRNGQSNCYRIPYLPSSLYLYLSSAPPPKNVNILVSVGLTLSVTLSTVNSATVA